MHETRVHGNLGSRCSERSPVHFVLRPRDRPCRAERSRKARVIYLIVMVPQTTRVRCEGEGEDEAEENNKNAAINAAEKRRNKWYHMICV